MTGDVALELEAPDDEGRRERRPPPPTPPASWRGWAEEAAPLRAFLAAAPRGRTWPELHAWARAEGVGSRLVNLVAWLELAGLAWGAGKGKAVRWVATGQARGEEDDVVTSAPALPSRPQRRRRRGRAG